MQRLSPELQTFFNSRRGARAAPPGSSVGRAENLACGDYVELAIHLRGAHLEVCWQGRGCSAVVALASLAATELDGAALATARDFDLARRVAELGGLPPARQHAVQVVARALGLALADCGRSCQS